MTSLQFVSSKPLHKDEALLQEEAAAALVGSGIIDAQAQVERWLNAITIYRRYKNQNMNKILGAMLTAYGSSAKITSRETQ